MLLYTVYEGCFKEIPAAREFLQCIIRPAKHKPFCFLLHVCLHLSSLFIAKIIFPGPFPW